MKKKCILLDTLFLKLSIVKYICTVLIILRNNFITYTIFQLISSIHDYSLNFSR